MEPVHPEQDRGRPSARKTMTVTRHISGAAIISVDGVEYRLSGQAESESLARALARPPEIPAGKDRKVIWLGGYGEDGEAAS